MIKLFAHGLIVGRGDCLSVNEGCSHGSINFASYILTIWKYCSYRTTFVEFWTFSGRRDRLLFAFRRCAGRGFRGGRVASSKFQRGLSNVFSKLLGEGALIAKSTINRDDGDGFIGLGEVVAGSLNTGSDDKFLNRHSESFVEFAVELSLRKAGQ